jgi:hypothetical protein
MPLLLLLATASLLSVTSGKPMDLTLDPPILVEVAKPKVDEGEAAYNRHLFEEKSFPWTSFIITVGLAAAGLAGQKQLRRKWKEWHTPVVLDPKTRALQTLQKISEEGTSATSYIELSDTVRGYVSEYYHLDAIHATTEEFLHKAAESPLIEQQEKQLLGKFLNQADLVKFAQQSVSESDYETAKETATQFINS